MFTKAAETYAKNTSAWADKETSLSEVFTGKVTAEEGCKKLAAEMNTALDQE